MESMQKEGIFRLLWVSLATLQCLAKAEPLGSGDYLGHSGTS